MSEYSEVIELERKLLRGDVRRDPNQIQELLGASFFEFGASGKIWSRDEVVESLPQGNGSPIEAEDFQCHQIEKNVFLITYRTIEDSRKALRSSIWKQDAGKWQMLFHQGTVTND